MTRYHPSASDRLIDSGDFPDEPDARDQAQLLDLAHAEWECGPDESMSQMFLDPAWDAEQAGADACLDDGRGSMTTLYKCPHCGWTYDPDERGYILVPQHKDPDRVAESCPGSQQHPRNAESDRRPLWKDGGVA